MDQREMWCRGYLRCRRPPEESNTLKPSRPTWAGAVGQQWGSNAGKRQQQNEGWQLRTP